MRAVEPPSPTFRGGTPEGDDAFGKQRPATERFRVQQILTSTREVVYDVTYSLDRNGFRLTEGGGPGADTYLFFGDSFTYGEGVEDDETMPAQFVRAMGGGVTAVNLAYHGFGPQSMLRLIETDGFAPAVTGPIRAAFYLGMADHANRVVGKYAWTQLSPRYVLDASGEPRFAGLFVDHPVAWLLNRMEIWRGLPGLVAKYVRMVNSAPEQRIELAAAIIARSARLLAERYQVGLTVLLWDQPNTASLQAALAARQINVTLVSGILGDLSRPELLIHPPFETHPNALADRALATWLAHRVSMRESQD